MFTNVFHYRWFCILFFFYFCFAGLTLRTQQPVAPPPRPNQGCALTSQCAVATKLCAVARVIVLMIRQVSDASALQDGSVVGSTPCVKVCVCVRARVCACVCVLLVAVHRGCLWRYALACAGVHSNTCTTRRARPVATFPTHSHYSLNRFY